MKRIFTLAFSLIIAATVSVSGQDAQTKTAKPAKKNTVSTPQRHKMSKEDSLKRVARMDSIRKVRSSQVNQGKPMEGKRPKFTREDSLKRVARMDSIRKIRDAEMKKRGGSKRLSKEDSARRVARIDSLRKVMKAKQEAAKKQKSVKEKEESDK